MADATEDAEDMPVIPTADQPSNSPDAEDDESEEVADFLAFSQNVRKKIPSRGEKDFEYHGTHLQISTLDASRQAMHDVLAEERYHSKDVERAVWDPEGNGAWVFKPCAKWTHAVGKSKWVPGTEGQDSKQPKGIKRLYLLPEEALWAIGRGSLDIRWPAQDGQAEDEGLPMPLQGAHATFIGREKEGGLTLEQFTVYQYLRRAGYYVLRAEDNWHNVPKSEYETAKSPLSTTSGLWTIWNSIIQPRTPDPNRFSVGPLISPGLYRDYASIYRLLSLIPYHDPLKSPSLVLADPNNATPSINYHVYKPSTNFRKTTPGPPDFYISVIDARQNLIPTEQEMEALLRQTPFHAPKSFTNNESVYQKLRKGTRNVILAIVDGGMSSFIRLSDAGFGNHALFDVQKNKAPRKFSGKKFKGQHRQTT